MKEITMLPEHLLTMHEFTARIQYEALWAKENGQEVEIRPDRIAQGCYVLLRGAVSIQKKIEKDGPEWRHTGHKSKMFETCQNVALLFGAATVLSESVPALRLLLPSGHADSPNGTEFIIPLVRSHE